MTLTILLGAAILLSAGYTFAVAVPRYIQIPGHRARAKIPWQIPAWRS